MRTQGFTLIELLVVITIIVVLLALLTPALDKAIYQAELTVCAANMHSIGMGAVNYAFENRRRYMHRDTVPNEGTPQFIAYPIFDWEDRPRLSRYFAINTLLNDVFVEPVDLEQTDEDTLVVSSQDLWFGFGYRGERGMFKVGDRFTWADRDGDGNAIGKRNVFNILAGDSDRRQVDAPWFATAHPDHDGIAYNFVLRDEDWIAKAALSASIPLGITKLTVTFWNADNNRGPIDNNYMYQDQSVTRVDRILYDNDERMVRVPDGAGGTTDESESGSVVSRLPR